ncbi:Dps family protein [Endozoicomonas numazuensis]|uniref:Dps family protein n=1 Tax=Endozoicomonas numazuensis TaxID=1137799 RepID=UPI002E81650B|nr:ferritin-like domain-containing protein [Endozoicomonas numazuensis]
MAVAVDDIAERIRALGIFAPGSYSAFAKLSAIQEVDEVLCAEEMIKTLTRGHEQLVKTARNVLRIAQQADDESTASLVSDRMRLH